MDDPLKVLLVSSEISPLLSTGGLADVASSLPRALHAHGVDVRAAMPCYASIPREYWGEQRSLSVAQLGANTEYGSLRESRLPGSAVPVYLVEHEGYFGRSHPYRTGAYEFGDNVERFCFFCQGLLTGLEGVGWIPDIIHCNDWHTAPIPIYLKTFFPPESPWHCRPSLFTIHNLAYQGRYGPEQFPNTGFPAALFSPEYLEYYGDLNLMKGAILFADKLNTVSMRYAEEIQTLDFGAGLEGVLRARSHDLTGIMNGIDYGRWSPARDPDIVARYSRKDMSGKAACKRHLQEQFQLPVRDVPLFGMVTRIDWQKGVDLVLDTFPRLMDHDVQVIVLGVGDPDLERAFAEAAAYFRGKVGFLPEFNAPMSHAIIAGSDFFLMPSRFEPCGLSQLYSLAYGTIPIVRRTGGLVDSVTDTTRLTLLEKRATGLMFGSASASALADAMLRAVRLYEHYDALAQVRDTGMKQDFSWDRSSERYLELYEATIEAACAPVS
jgi:starch synthase